MLESFKSRVHCPVRLLQHPWTIQSKLCWQFNWLNLLLLFCYSSAAQITTRFLSVDCRCIWSIDVLLDLGNFCDLLSAARETVLETKVTKTTSLRQRCSIILFYGLWAIHNRTKFWCDLIKYQKRNFSSHLYYLTFSVKIEIINKDHTLRLIVRDRNT